MSDAGGHPGLVLKQRPRRYPATPQQVRFREALQACDIRKGISKAELMEKMVHCIPAFFRRRHEKIEDIR